MASIIVDEGDGGRVHPLDRARTVVGSNPRCDLQLRHLSATGTRFVIESAGRPARIRVLKGEVRLNGRVVLASELRHNDALGVGETTLIYVDPPADGRATPQSPAQADAAATLRALQELSDALGRPPRP
ncbi:MAG TPA: FHA domain-containing protein [Planctomycetota bacterium]|nr:FHA domain-containing protein [Planctomycetota bacterium]